MKRISQVFEEDWVVVNFFIMTIENIQRRNKNLADEIRFTLKLLGSPVKEAIK